MAVLNVAYHFYNCLYVFTLKSGIDGQVGKFISLFLEGKGGRGEWNKWIVANKINEDGS